MTTQPINEAEYKEWLAIRKEAGRKIDPETAEVIWDYGSEIDPYGILPEVPGESGGIGRHYFARSPRSDIWVWFPHLPDQIRDALWEKLEAGDFSMDFKIVNRHSSDRPFRRG